MRPKLLLAIFSTIVLQLLSHAFLVRSTCTQRPYVESFVFLLDYVKTELYTKHNVHWHVWYDEAYYMIRKSVIFPLFLAPI